MENRRKIVIVGLDSATWDIINPWIKRGWLPNIKRMEENGVSATCISFPPITGPAWVSFATGKNPGKHGVYSFFRTLNDLSKIVTITSKDIKGEVFYEILKEKNIEPILINLPGTYPPKIKNNIIITSLLTQGKKCVFPSSLKDEFPILKKYKLFPSNLVDSSRDEEGIREIRELEMIRFKCAKGLFLKKKWDFFFYLISGSDWIQHTSYNNMYYDNITRNSECVKAFMDFDKYIGWFIDNAPLDTNIILMSDHGARVCKKIFSVNKWLEEEGYLETSHKKVKDKGEEELEISGYKKITINVQKWFWFILNNPFLFKIAKKTYDKIGRFIPFHLDLRVGVDVSHSKAYHVPNTHGIYINDKKRFNSGIVSKNNYEKIRLEIYNKLKNLKDEEGDYVLDMVKLKEEIFHGPELINAPDILISSKKYKIWHGIGPKFILGDFNFQDEFGMFIAYGPDIKKNVRIGDITIQDLAPTILHMFGLAIPKDMDGRVLKEIFDENSSLFRKKIKYDTIELDSEKNKILKKITKIREQLFS